METLTHSNWFLKKVDKSEALPPADLDPGQAVQG